MPNDSNSRERNYFSIKFSKAFLKAEYQLIVRTITSPLFLMENLQANPPDYVTAAYRLIVFPSLREREGSDVVEIIANLNPNSMVDEEEVWLGFEQTFDRIREDRTRKYYSEEFVELVRMALDTDPLLEVCQDRRKIKPLGTRGINAIYWWVRLQGDPEVVIPTRSIATVLSLKFPESGRRILRLAEDADFLECTYRAKPNASGTPSRYRWVGCEIARELHPRVEELLDDQYPF
jgi:hypothetical protein